jgi:SAM-dependent methyltransferase
MFKVIPQDIQTRYSHTISPILISKINNAELLYEPLDPTELHNYIVNYINILSSDLIRAGEGRISHWESGWKENLDEFKKSLNPESLIPKYHKKNNIARLNKQIVKTHSKDFDYHLHSFFIDALLLEHIPNYKKVFEFGCGTGYHLFRLKNYFPENSFYGGDWSIASQNNIAECAKAIGADNINGFNFNYFEPDYSIDIKDSLVYTVASLEQIGEKHDKVLDYFVSSKPGLCIHFEPIHEVLDPDNLLDYLTIQYFNKRNYLKNYLTSLQNLEREGKIRILDVRRLYYGSKFIEGHTVIIWKPV